MTPKGISVATGNGRCGFARTERAWLRDYLANDGRKSHETSIRPCGIGGRRCGLASLPSYPADWLRCLMRAPSAPAPDVLRRWRRSPPSEHRPSSGRGQARAQPPTAPVAGEYITDMVRFVKVVARSFSFPRRRPSSQCRSGYTLSPAKEYKKSSFLIRALRISDIYTADCRRRQ